MSRQDDLFHDVRLTGQEASRLLDALENDSEEESLINPRSSDSVPPDLQSTETTKPDHLSGCWVFLMVLGLMVGGGLLIAFLVEGLNNSTLINNNELGFRDSCGSKASATGRWWPVLGTVDATLLSSVRDSYCGDAYINEDGALQVASFATEDEARAFAEKLSRATGSGFRVGQGQN